MKGKVVKIIGCESVPRQFVGSYGIVKEFAYGDKWMVEIRARVTGSGSLAHTVRKSDFEVIGALTEAGGQS